MPLEFQRVEFSEKHIGSGLFESITKGLYNKPLHVIREYVQNETEANPPPERISIELEGNTLSILGDGGGMSHQELDEAIKVGVSQKDPATHSGFRGIGIWSGVSIARQILLTTKRKDMDDWLVLRIDAEGIMKKLKKRSKQSLIKMLSEHTFRASTQGRHGEHGTHVQLIDLNEEITSEFQEKEILSYVRNVLPVGFDNAFPFAERVQKRLQHDVSNYRCFSIWFNGQEVRRPPYITDLEEPLFEEIQHKDKPLAYIWSSIHKDSNKIEEYKSRGIVFKQWNITIGDRDSLKHMWKQPFVSEWYAGEVHIIDGGILADSPRMWFESSPAFEELRRQLRKCFRRLEKGARRKSDLSSLQLDLEKAKGLLEQLFQADSEDAIKQWKLSASKTLEKLLKKVRKRTTTESYKGRVQLTTSRLRSALESLEQPILEEPKLSESSQTEPSKATELPGDAFSIDTSAMQDANGTQAALVVDPLGTPVEIVSALDSLSAPIESMEVLRKSLEAIETVLDDFLFKQGIGPDSIKKEIVRVLSKLYGSEEI